MEKEGIMNKRKTYGQRMAEFEDERDRADWQRRLSEAVNKEDTVYVEELMKEGRTFGYELSDDALLRQLEMRGYITKYRK